MNSDKFLKKISLFYHPIFQNFVNEWMKILQSKSANVNLIEFLEINIRIQKCLIEEFTIINAVNSALTDWYREIMLLTTDNNLKKDLKKTPKKDKEYLVHLSDQITALSFDSICSQERYMTLLKINGAHQAFKFYSNLLSPLAFGKFIFDLCSSWCEILDIELFVFFSMALLLHCTDFGIDRKLELKKLRDIETIAAGFHTHVKMYKQHYSRYKKIDNSNYNSFYEWNYLPVRLVEVKNKCVETLLNIYPNELIKIEKLQNLIEQGIDEVISRNLANPTMNHFKTSNEELALDSNDNLNSSPKDSRSSKISISKEGEYNMEQSVKGKLDLANKHLKLEKKIAIPIFGKTIIKEPEDENIITIKTFSVFADKAKEEQVKTEPSEQPTGLDPIWEREVSECSTATLGSKDRVFTDGDFINMKAREDDLIKASPKFHDEKNFVRTFYQGDKRFQTEGDQVSTRKNLKFHTMEDEAPTIHFDPFHQTTKSRLTGDDRKLSSKYDPRTPSPFGKDNLPVLENRNIHQMVYKPTKIGKMVYDTIISDFSNEKGKINSKLTSARATPKKIDEPKTPEPSLNALSSHRMKLREITKRRPLSQKRDSDKMNEFVIFGKNNINPEDEKILKENRLIPRAATPVSQKNTITYAPRIPSKNIHSVQEIEVVSVALLGDKAKTIRKESSESVAMRSKSTTNKKEGLDDSGEFLFKSFDKKISGNKYNGTYYGRRFTNSDIKNKSPANFVKENNKSNHVRSFNGKD